VVKTKQSIAAVTGVVRVPERWKPVKMTSASGRIVEQIRQALFAGALKPGDFLGSEHDLAREFGVSRLPVRDALGRLEAMGIVEIKVGARGGVRVASGNPSRFADALAVQFKLIGVTAEELFDAQRAVETRAVELAAIAATPDDLALLRERLEEMAGQLDSPEAFTQNALAFHFEIVEASHNRALVAQMQALQHAMYATYAPHTTRKIAAGVLTKHTRLLQRIEAGDAPGARDAVISHLAQVRDRVLAGVRDAARPAPNTQPEEE
jgi:GntR family transcriptional regulator, transcriptional repressor for pyruvate dehydrogenase complex